MSPSPFIEIIGSCYGASTTLSADYVGNWISSGRWPDHGLTPEAITVGFDEIGNLVELSSEQDGPAMTALVQEAQVLALAKGFLSRQITLPPDVIVSVAREILTVTAKRLDDELRETLERLSVREFKDDRTRGSITAVGALP